MHGEGVVTRRAGQATIEFAFAAPLFFLCFFAAIDAALWAIQSSAAVSAAEQGARLAAAAATTPLSEDTPSPAVLLAAVRGQLQQAMFATTVVAWCDPAAGQCVTPSAAGGGGPFARCPTSPAAVEERFGARTIAICDETSAPAPPCPPPPQAATPRCDDPPTVAVHVVGFMASLVPPISGFGWHAGEIPINVVATTHSLRFAT
jgi:hypothetical protein